MRLTWEQYAWEAKRTAAGLLALRLKPGDRAGLWATNSVEWVMLQFGCALAGVVLVNVNPAYRSHELSFVLKKSRMKALFLREKDQRSDYRRILEESRAGQDLETRCATVGCAVPETEVRIASPETGETVPAGQQGELLARGYMVMGGYDGEPEATRRAVDTDGWLHTGDLAVMRPDGYFRITGRQGLDHPRRREHLSA